MKRLCMQKKGFKKKMPTEYVCAICDRSDNTEDFGKSGFRNTHDDDCMCLHNSHYPDMEPCGYVCDDCYPYYPCDCYEEVYARQENIEAPGKHWHGATFYLLGSSGNGYAVKDDLMWRLENKWSGTLLPYGTYIKFHDTGSHIMIVEPSS